MKSGIVFKTDYATRKKGEAWACDPMLASHLVNVEKVADYDDKTKASLNAVVKKGEAESKAIAAAAKAKADREKGIAEKTIKAKHKLGY